MAKESADKKLKDLLEELRVRRAGEVPDHSADCPGPEILGRFRATQDDAERQRLLARIVRCRACMEDLAFSLSEARTASAFARLGTLRQALPALARKLAVPDLVALCRKLRSLARELAEDAASETLQLGLDEVFGRLESRAPAFAVALRGKEKDTSAPECVSDEAIEELAGELQKDVQKQLDAHQVPEWESEEEAIACPELFLFDRMTPALRERSIRIRDWCEERLEGLHAQEMSTCHVSHGVGHSKRVLRLGADLLRAFSDSFPDAFSHFAIYTASNCHDLGLMPRPGEDLSEPGVASEICKSHGRRTVEFIMGKPGLGIAPAWRSMGFGSECEARAIAGICAAHQRECGEELHRLPRSEPIFTDGETYLAAPMALAALLRLSDELDCSMNRLPSAACLLRRDIPQAELSDYVKHELVESCIVDSAGVLRIHMRVRYVYPSDLGLVQRVRRELEEEIDSAARLLKGCGVNLGKAQFSCDEALFLEEHPYIRASRPPSQ
jgi:hypothetical protein